MFRLFCDVERLTEEAVKQLRIKDIDGVAVFPYSAVAGHIMELVEITSNGKIWVMQWWLY